MLKRFTIEYSSYISETFSFIASIIVQINVGFFFNLRGKTDFSVSLAYVKIGYLNYFYMEFNRCKYDLMHVLMNFGVVLAFT